MGRTFIDKENLKEKGGGLGVLEIQKGSIWSSYFGHEEDRSILSELWRKGRGVSEQEGQPRPQCALQLD